MNTKWFTVSLTAVRVSMKRRGEKIFSGSLPISDVLAGCRGGKNCGQQYYVVALRRRKNVLFISAGLVMSRLLDATIWSGESAEEVEAEILEILLEKYKRSEGWINHGVSARQISYGKMDAIARTLLQPVLDKYENDKKQVK